jgi:PhnB protein
MQSNLNAYLTFRDNAREAMEFYHSIFGGKLVMQTFKDGHISPDPSEDDKIMHAMLTADNGIVFMASDTSSSMDGEYCVGTHMSMSLHGDNEAELAGYYEKLLKGGTVQMPLEEAPWGDRFGMLTDKFGIAWMVNISKPRA